MRSMIREPLSLELLKQIGVYFYIPDGPFSPDYFHYSAECLIGGLRELGVPVSSNLEIEGATHHALAEMRDHLYVFCLTERAVSAELLDGIGAFQAPYRMIISNADSTSSWRTPAGVPALLAHECRHWKVAGTRIPWAIGLSPSRVRAATSAPRPMPEREPKVLCNFTSTPKQGVRDFLHLAFVPLLQRIGLAVDMEKSSAQDHFRRLQNYTGCLAYGGIFLEDPLKMREELNPTAYQFRKNCVEMTEPVVILRWDSWRFWESLASGALTFNLDLDKYGLAFPVMPEPWVHYIPIDLSDLTGTVERLQARHSEWAAIAENGQRWALEHYSPAPTARRFLDTAVQHHGG